MPSNVTRRAKVTGNLQQQNEISPIDCPDCDNGIVPCSPCNGHGYFRCSSCGGSGHPICPNCGGDGYVQRADFGINRFAGRWGFNFYTHSEQCFTCGGMRILTNYGCASCNGQGTIPHSNCNGTGKLLCETCGGRVLSDTPHHFNLVMTRIEPPSRKPIKPRSRNQTKPITKTNKRKRK